MNTKRVNAAADVVARAMANGRRAPAAVAVALESAQMLMSPEIAAELERLQARVDEVERAYTFDTAELKRQLDTERVSGARLMRAEQRRAELEAVIETHRKDDQAEIERLRARVAELEAERHSTNEALDDAVQELRGRREDEPAEVPPLVVYRASYDSIVMGRYTTAAEARKHCESVLRREEPDAKFAWTDEDEGIQDLTFTVDGEFQDWSGYVVTALEVASKFDEDGDE